MVGVVAVEEVQRPAVIDLAKAQHVDQKGVALLKLRCVEIDVRDLARPVRRVGCVFVIAGVANHSEIASLQVNEAEAVAAAGSGNPCGASRGAAARDNLLHAAL